MPAAWLETCCYVAQILQAQVNQPRAQLDTGASPSCASSTTQGSLVTAKYELWEPRQRQSLQQSTPKVRHVVQQAASPGAEPWCTGYTQAQQGRASARLKPHASPTNSLVIWRQGCTAGGT